MIKKISLLLGLFLGFAVMLPNVILAQAVDLEAYFKEKNITPKRSADGIYYSIEREGKGALPRKGSYIKMRYVGRLMDGTVFDQSPEGESFVYRAGIRQLIDGWERGMNQLREGSKATLYIPSKMAYGARSVGKVPADASLIIEVDFEKILSDAEYEKYTESLEKKEKEAFERKKKEQFQQDLAIMKRFAQAKNLSVNSTLSGLSYVITKKGKGATPIKGDKVAVQYEAFLSDDTSVDASKKEPYRFVVGIGKVMPGWDEGIKFFPKGAEGWLLVPSALAYGGLAIKENNIPANATLFFKIKVVEVGK